MTNKEAPPIYTNFHPHAENPHCKTILLRTHPHTYVHSLRTLYRNSQQHTATIHRHKINNHVYTYFKMAAEARVVLTRADRRTAI